MAGVFSPAAPAGRCGLRRREACPQRHGGQTAGSDCPMPAALPTSSTLSSLRAASVWKSRFAAAATTLRDAPS